MCFAHLGIGFYFLCFILGLKIMDSQIMTNSLTTEITKVDTELLRD